MRLFRTKKSRRYPIQRDGRGRTLRQRCFELFDEGMRPVEVAKELRMKISTVNKYFQQWKQLGPNFEKQYAYVKGLFTKTAPDRDYNIGLFAGACGISKEEFETILAKPHGLRRFMTGKFYFPVSADADHKLHVALKLSLLLSDHLIKNGGKFEDVRYAFERWMKENQESRKVEDVDIKEENQEVAFTRQILEAADKAEQEGRVKRDKLSEEEINTIIRYGEESEVRNFETLYWFRIGKLKSEGLSAKKTFRCESFFNVDWAQLVANLPEPILVIGNPPWVTNSALGLLGSSNLPDKSNFQGRSGFDAITGKSNFDISEWRLIKLLDALDNRSAYLAMLCKTAVARKALYHSLKSGIRVESSSVQSIDSKRQFDASVEACLLCFRLGV